MGIPLSVGVPLWQARLRRGVALAALAALCGAPGAALAFGALSGSAAQPAPRVTSPEDDAAMLALARLPVADRRAALEATLHPALLQEIGALLAQTRASFEGIAGAVAPERRATAWELARNPALLDALLAPGVPSAEQVAERLAGQPDDLVARVRAFAAAEPDALEQMHALRAFAEARFGEILDPHPAGTQVAFRRLLRQPDALALLVAHPDVVATLGELFWNDPGQAENLLASYRGEPPPPASGPSGEVPPPPTHSGAVALGGPVQGSGVPLVLSGGWLPGVSFQALGPASGLGPAFPVYGPAARSAALPALDPRIATAPSLWASVGGLALRRARLASASEDGSAPRLRDRPVWTGVVAATARAAGLAADRRGPVPPVPRAIAQRPGVQRWGAALAASRQLREQRAAAFAVRRAERMSMRGARLGAGFGRRGRR